MPWVAAASAPTQVTAAAYSGITSQSGRTRRSQCARSPEAVATASLYDGGGRTGPS